jgi:DNA-binding NarL/FixJ family response regulator
MANQPSAKMEYERRITLRMLVEGNTVWEVADYFHMKPRTLEVRLLRMRRDWNCNTNIEMVVRMVLEGYIKVGVLRGKVMTL